MKNIGYKNKDCYIFTANAEYVRRINHGVKNHRVKTEWKKRPEGLNVTVTASTPLAPLSSVVNGWTGQRNVMEAASTPKNTGKRKSGTFSGSNDDESHLKSDEHLFAIQYKKFSKYVQFCTFFVCYLF